MISEQMIDAILDQNLGEAKNNSLNFKLFSKFLDMNPIIRTIVLKSINP